MLTTGVLLLATGHRSNEVLTIHKVGTIAFGVLLTVHLLAYAVDAIRAASNDWRTGLEAVAGRDARAMLVAAAVGGGVARAVALLPTINSYGH